MASLTLRQARRIAVRAQGLGSGRPRGRVDVRHLRRVVERLGLLQLDFVNVVAPSHYLVPFSRLGPYDRDRLDRMAYRDRELTEQWAHEACLVPVESWPLLEHRRCSHSPRPTSFGPFLEANPGYVERVLEVVRDHGPVLPNDLPEPDGGPHRLEHAWFGTARKAVLEHHFGRGRLAIADRLSNFARVYDLVERIVPAEHREVELERPEQHRRLLLRAARAQGVATGSDLADYLRLPVAQVRPRLAELVARGDLDQVEVAGWQEPAYLHPGAVIPRKVEGAALLSPFDPLIWTRPRTRRLFGFDYRFEIFIPAEQRRWGAYVLPFLRGDRLVARVDLKAHRPGRTLRVQGAWIEDHASPTEVAPSLARELTTLAHWLDLDDVQVDPRGDLATPLRHALTP